ncbi:MULTISPECIES: hypothetical protein [unclassified Rhizobium]|nr:MULTISPECIES: hypothetical protein [unclassified Rhizobium]
MGIFRRSFGARSIREASTLFPFGHSGTSILAVRVLMNRIGCVTHARKG